MKKSVKIVLLLYLIALFLIALSEFIEGIGGEILYLIAYALPIFFGFLASKKLRAERESESGVSEPLDRLFTLRGRDAGLIIPLIAPSVGLIFLSAYVTSLILGAFGLSNSLTEMGGFVKMVMLHALLPCTLEELLFRYIPMKIILPYSRRECIIVSALAFSVFHMNVFQIPYAFFAGLIFIFIDIVFESVWPSIILHFVNNTVSVIWVMYCADSLSATLFISVLSSLALVSVAVIIYLSRKYRSRVAQAFEKPPVSSCPPEIDKKGF